MELADGPHSETWAGVADAISSPSRPCATTFVQQLLANGFCASSRVPVSVWLLGRIYCTGTPDDHAAVHKLQDEFKLVPLSAYGKPYTPPAGKVDPAIDMKAAVRDQVNRMDAVSYSRCSAS